MTEHLQIGASEPRVQYTGNGVQTTFPYPFAIFANNDLEVYLDDTPQGSGFSVLGAGDSAGGSVVFATAPDDGVLVTLRRNVVISYAPSFSQNMKLTADSLNGSFARLTASLQQVASNLNRSLVLSPVDPAGNLVLPGSSERASALLGFDAQGLPTAYAVSDFVGATGPQGPQGVPGIGDVTASNNLAELTSMAAARNNLGLGSAAQSAATDFASAAHNHDSAYAPIGSTATDYMARDQIAATNLRLLLASSVASGALVQGYQWEFATDEWGATSTNETYAGSGPAFITIRRWAWSPSIGRRGRLLAI
jgi:hypothetical protein